MALTAGARTVFERGCGYGYFSWRFTRAVGLESTIYCTDDDAQNRSMAEGFLTRVGRWDRVKYRNGYAQDILAGFGLGDSISATTCSGLAGSPKTMANAPSKPKPFAVTMNSFSPILISMRSSVRCGMVCWWPGNGMGNRTSKMGYSCFISQKSRRGSPIARERDTDPLPPGAFEQAR